VRHELEVYCLPVDMPEKIEVDVTSLDLGNSIHIGDIDIGDKMRLVGDSDLTVVTVVAPVAAEEEVPEKELEEAEGVPAEETEAAG
jgi:large subunit ribosomal protein L25